jgi:protease PrsW
MITAFQRSERATREWVGAGLDLDIELLDLIRSELFASTRFGTYLDELRARFGGVVTADMFCLLRLELELSVQAKAMLLARDAGLELPVTADLRASLREFAALQASIGRTGLIALAPLQVSSDRDRWHRYLLAADAAASR